MTTPPGLKGAIKDWWAANPMTYGQIHGQASFGVGDGGSRRAEPGSADFFRLSDQTFYAWNRPLHYPGRPFGRLFPYQSHRGKRVLEVGCGLGCLAMNWSTQGARVTALDLNPTAVHLTRERFKILGLEDPVLQADAERLPFEDSSFDYVYSWGVLHHTPRIGTALDQIHRVLKPGGSAGVMVYHRGSILYRYLVSYLEGYLHLENRFLNPLELASRYGDAAAQEGNPYTWPLTRKEARRLFTRFEGVRIKVLGTDLPTLLDNWFPGLGTVILPRSWLKALARRWGWSLWITGQKVD